jgi:hypothetical protein
MVGCFSPEVDYPSLADGGNCGRAKIVLSTKAGD